MMNLVWMHYHLGPGGVTRVIRNHLQSLLAYPTKGQIASIALLHGPPVEEEHVWNEVPGSPIRIQVDSLAYDDLDDKISLQVASELRHHLNQLGFSPTQTMIHVHNHSLGKNSALPGAICQLAREGYRFLLQIHDFVEDSRPANYRQLIRRWGPIDRREFNQRLYPQASHIHYAVLNRRDFQLLATAGVAPQHLHWLPNPIEPPREAADRTTARNQVFDHLGLPVDQTYLLYPVRAIRRKNIGEAVLWSALVQEHAVVAISLPPGTESEVGLYKRWKTFVDQHGLPCLFDVGQTTPPTFAQHLAAADAVLTTSVAEGFGMVFLESWLAGRPLVGRDLPEITADFRQAGMKLDHLYQRLPTPLEWLDRDEIDAGLRQAHQQLAADYGAPPATAQSVEDVIRSRTENDHIDFALLTSRQQMSVIRRVVSDPTCRKRLSAIADRILATIHQPPVDLIAHNAECVKSQFSLQRCADQLASIYHTLESSPVDRSIASLESPDRMLKYFLDEQRIHPIRIES